MKQVPICEILCGIQPLAPMFQILRLRAIIADERRYSHRRAELIAALKVIMNEQLSNKSAA